MSPEGTSSEIFVGNLAFTVTEQDVRDLSAPCGVVDRITLMTDRETGRLSGFGFVEMADDQAVQAAMTALHGQELAGRALNVNAARPCDERRPSGGGPRGGGGGRRW
jgi:RNA recognition motif-containing protein